MGHQRRVLLTSVFKPFAQDDEFGARAINPAELYHNQVTREQGPFSLRMFHRSWGLMLLQRNITAPCTVLDFPTRERFVRELRTHHYDVVGISSIVVNVGKVREMCRLAREHAPKATIVVGGHVTSIAGSMRITSFAAKGSPGCGSSSVKIPAARFRIRSSRRHLASG